MHSFTFIISSIFFFITGCSDIYSLFKEPELAISNGTIIEATNKHGTIKIEAKKNLQRTYSWLNESIDVTLIPRAYRWYGSLGAYNPSGGKRNLHVVVEEGQQHFCSEQEALEWLMWQNERLQYVYTPDGLVVGWNTSKDSKSGAAALVVDMWQFYINGEKPKNLHGATDNKITVFSKPGATHPNPLVGEFTPNKPRQFNGRLFSGKAIDYMNDKAVNLKPADVKKIITEGKFDKREEFQMFYLLESPYPWVMVDKNNRVILIGR